MLEPLAHHADAVLSALCRLTPAELASLRADSVI